MRNPFKKADKPTTVVIDLAKKSAAGDFDHVNCHARRLGFKYDDYECINSVWYFYNVTNLPDVLPEWLEVRK